MAKRHAYPRSKRSNRLSDPAFPEALRAMGRLITTQRPARPESEAVTETGDAGPQNELPGSDTPTAVPLREQHRFLQCVIESLPYPFYVVNARDYTIRHTNAAARAWGVRDGMTCSTCLHFHDGPCVHGSQACPLEHVRRTKQNAVRERPLTDANGVRRIVEVSAIPVQGADGHVTDMIEFMIDLTARRTAEEELKHAVADIRQANADMEGLLCTVTHALKSPLASIRGFAKLIAADVAAERTDRLGDFSDRIIHTGEHMLESIDELLQLCQIGRAATTTEDVSLTALVDDWVRNNEAMLAEKQTTVEVPRDLPALRIDRLWLTEAVENLLCNAVKYGCPEAGGRIECGAEADEREIRIFVRDFGPGIAGENHERAFELFQRLDRTLEGTGVGLAIVRRVAEFYGGRAWVDSALGQGATFWMAFPKSAVGIENATEARAQSSAPNPARGVPFAFKTIRRSPPSSGSARPSRR